jgi:hypothetical protein
VLLFCYLPVQHHLLLLLRLGFFPGTLLGHHLLGTTVLRNSDTKFGRPSVPRWVGFVVLYSKRV